MLNGVLERGDLTTEPGFRVSVPSVEQRSKLCQGTSVRRHEKWLTVQLLLRVPFVCLRNRLRTENP